MLVKPRLNNLRRRHAGRRGGKKVLVTPPTRTHKSSGPRARLIRERNIGARSNELFKWGGAGRQVVLSWTNARVLCSFVAMFGGDDGFEGGAGAGRR